MPFHKTPLPFTRTLQYLRSGNIILRDSVKVITLGYATDDIGSRGTREFVYWQLPSIAFKNPTVQLLTFKDLTPTPWLKAYLDTGDQVLMDVDSQSTEEITARVKRVLGKTEQEVEEDRKAVEKKYNPANFGEDYYYQCLCEIPGQVPCSQFHSIPRFLRDKHQLRLREELDKDLDEFFESHGEKIAQSRRIPVPVRYKDEDGEEKIDYKVTID